MTIHLVKFAPGVDGCVEDLWPQLQALLLLTAATSFVKFAKPLLLTSLYREALHEGDLHTLHRAFDIDVDEQDKWGGLLPDEAQAISGIINKYTIYDYERPYLKCFVYGDIDLAGRHYNHAHIQVHPRTTIQDFFP